MARSGAIWILLSLSACAGSEGTLLVRKSDAGPGETALWQPPPDARFQVQLTGSLDTDVEADVFVIDLDYAQRDFDTLAAAGRRTVCHFSAGSVESFRSDAEQLPERVRGNELDDYPDERWLDVRSDLVRDVMLARLDRAESRGCSAVVPTNLDVHAEDSGFALSEAEALAYARFLVAEAHQRGLSVTLSTEQFVSPLVDELESALAFSCLEPGGCAPFRPFLDAGKALWVVEEGDAQAAPDICADAASRGLNVIVKDSEFEDFRVGCAD